MPFTKKERRKPMLQGLLLDPEPGDLCFAKYYHLIQAWQKQPRWKTVDKIWEPILPSPDMRAHFLAALVHFILHAMKYEKKMQRKNGDVWKPIKGILSA